MECMLICHKTIQLTRVLIPSLPKDSLLLLIAANIGSQ